LLADLDDPLRVQTDRRFTQEDDLWIMRGRLGGADALAVAA
jgi:hypothetical protein